MNYSFLLISAPLFAALVLHRCADANLVQDTCKKISQRSPLVKYDFCVAAFKSDPSSRTARSLEQLAFISLKLDTSNAKALVPRIRSLLNDKKFDEYAKRCLQDCLDLYSDAISSLNDAVADFKARDYMKANIDVSAAMEAPDTCEDQFKEKQGEATPLTKENSYFTQLTAISLSLTNMDCLDLYSDAISSLNDAVADFKARDYMKANIDVSAAMEAPDTCEDQF
ncbi:hypothetical protein Nepgr_011104 [Nepenthes gracilis]|uniref:Pectinesterase inhibitor domain-containing protein n=1 Tax=Nepenthes gracilis TaxID=150966 RepID=A0AAD3SDN2_NEPGR|nr:hypothetical protein Nepgr_011104 [Nepenthes gracilis]